MYTRVCTCCYAHLQYMVHVQGLPQNKIRTGYLMIFISSQLIKIKFCLKLHPFSLLSLIAFTVTFDGPLSLNAVTLQMVNILLP